MALKSLNQKIKCVKIVIKIALQSLNANRMNLERWVRVLRRDEDEDQFKQNI